MPRATGESLCAFRGSFEMNDSNKLTCLYCLLHVHVVHVDDYNLRITNKMCDVPNDFHVHLSPLCSWLWPGAGCSRLPGLRLRHCLTGEVCCARRCHDVCCFLQILISWVSWVSFEVSCCFFIVSWRFLFAKKLQSFGVPCWMSISWAAAFESLSLHSCGFSTACNIVSQGCVKPTGIV